MKQLLLVGNPNCGKTTLFNLLTGDKQKVGNWPGVTVEKKEGQFSYLAEQYVLTDIPGIYSLSTDAMHSSLDEQIAVESINTLPVDCLINVVDACHLERHLYLTSQLLELGKPMVVVLNMMDLAASSGIAIDVALLERKLGCKVVQVQAHKGIGLLEVQKAVQQISGAAHPFELKLPALASAMLQKLEQHMTTYKAKRLLEGDYSHWQPIVASDNVIFNEETKNLDMVMADARYQKIHEVVTNTQTKRTDSSEHFTAKLDKIILHRFFAIPLFLLVMYLMFLFAINIGGAFQGFFDIAADTIFVKGSAWLLASMHAPSWLIAIIAEGLGKGINTTVSFIPVLASMYFFLSMLETSGYLARAAFVVDRAMRALGLPGKAFVPMIVGFGCNVPAIMAARTLDNERDRLLTIMMSPFMSCSARLAIYTVFVAAFFKTGGQNVVFSLYLIGILMAVFTGYLLRKTLLKGQASTLILELPVYHKPTLKRLMMETYSRVSLFIVRASKIIIPVCVLLSGLNALTLSGGLSIQEGSTSSVLSWIGQAMTPLFAPMGITPENWPASVGLLTGMLAKEVVVGTLNTLYVQTDIANMPFDLWAGLSDAFWSIPQNLAQLGHALWNPIAASAKETPLAESFYGVMASKFDGQAGAYAYLLFVLLYIPCASTMAVIRQEANRQLMYLSIVWSSMVAYVTAVGFYQSMRFFEHPQQSITWLVSIGLSLFFMGKLISFKKAPSNAFSNS